MEQRLTLITLGVADLARSIAFYEGLGWRRSVRDAAGVAFFQLGGIALSLYPVENLAADLGQPLPAPGPSAIMLAHNCRTRDDVDAVLVAIEAAGGRIVRTGHAMEWGGYSGFAADPDGHIWEIAWNPGFPLDAAGAVALPD
jgi:hypothetical protein